MSSPLATIVVENLKNPRLAVRYLATMAAWFAFSVAVQAQSEPVVDWGGNHTSSTVKFRGEDGTTSGAVEWGDDSTNDDSRRIFPFSETNPLSPALGGVYGGNSAVFFGGLEKWRVNTATAPSGNADEITNNASADEIFLFNVGNGADRRAYALLTWKKEHFLSSRLASPSTNVVFGEDSSMTLDVSLLSDGLRLHPVVKNGTSYYISQIAIGSQGLFTLSATDLATMTWAPYNPAANLQAAPGNPLGAGALNYTVPTSQLDDVQAVGFYAEVSGDQNPTAQNRVKVRRFFASLAEATPEVPLVEWQVDAASYLGGTGSTDGVQGAAIASDGSVVLAANISDAAPGGLTPVVLGNATTGSSGAIVRLSKDGRTVLSVTRIAAEVSGVALDASDHIYVAARTDGMLKLSPAADALIWQRPNAGSCDRIDVSPSGRAVGLRGDWNSSGWTANGPGTICVYDANGGSLGEFPGHHFTQDVAIDDATQSVFSTGFMNKKTCPNPPTWPNGAPVQVAYLRSQSFDGVQKWKGYDWTGSELYAPCPESGGVDNVADTRGYRVAMGRDGFLYMGGEMAGGNHMFRYAPFNLTVPVSIVGGDRYHSLDNSEAHHRTWIGRYDAATGNHLLGQTWTARASDGKGQSLWLRSGDIAADEDGRVAVATYAYPSPTFTTDPTPSAGAETSSPHLVVFSQDFTKRLIATRLNPSGGEAPALALRKLPGEDVPNVVFGGWAPSGVVTANPVQPANGGANDGMFLVIDQSNANEIILVLDNTDSQGITFSGSWSTATIPGGYLGSNFRHDANAGKGSKSVTFTPQIPVADDYEVFVRHTYATNTATNAPWTVNHAGGSVTVPVNQTVEGGRWISLGTYPFEAGAAGTIVLSNTGTSARVIADAIRLIKR